MTCALCSREASCERSSVYELGALVRAGACSRHRKATDRLLDRHVVVAQHYATRVLRGRSDSTCMVATATGLDRELELLLA